MDVIIFSLADCEHCQDLKKRLFNEQIPFRDFEINKHKPFWDDIVKQTGSDYVPTIYLKDDKTKTGRILVPLKDFTNGDEAIKIIKKYTL
jgi:glutaredoxin